jgi:inorganic pyrophosphatase
VVGVIQLLDHDEADDKIIAILENDLVYGHIRDIEELPKVLVERMQHYFKTYKMIPGEKPGIELINVSGPEKAKKIVTAAIQDYEEAFGRT